MMRLLIVDDNPLDSKLMAELCRHRWPQTVTVAETTGAAGLARLARESFDVILLDYMLPDMDGLAWLKQAGPLKARSPVIMLTWFGDEKIAAEAVLSGAAAYVSKEDVPDLLTVSIERVVRHRRAVRRIRHLRRQISRDNQHRRNILDSVPLIIYTTDRDFRLVQVNQAFREQAVRNGAAGLADDRQILGRPLLDFLAPGPERDNCHRLMADVLAHGQMLKQRVGGNDASGQRHSVLLISPLISGGAIDGLIFCCQDVSEQVQNIRLEVQAERLAQHNRRLRETDAFKSEFLASVSHDLRAPLTSIIACAEMCEDLPPEQSDQLRQHLGAIREQAGRLNHMICDLLDLSQMQSRRRQWQIEPIAAGPVVEKVVQMHAPLCGGRSLQLNVHVEADLPEIAADREGLERVLSNLIANAVKFTDAGGVEVRVERWRNQCPLPERIAWDGEPAVLISVEDTGAGIEPEQLESLFERPRGPRVRRKGQGFGLGLQICHQIALQHGGRIWATSVPTVGSRFNVLWPTERNASPQTVTA